MKIDMTEYIEALDRNSILYIDEKRARNLLSYYNSQKQANLENVYYVMDEVSGGKAFLSLDKLFLKKFFLEDLRLPKEYFYVNGSFSLSQKEVLIPLLKNSKVGEDLKEFLEAYLCYKRYEGLIQTFRPKFDRCEPLYDNIVGMHYQYGFASTGRLRYFNEGIHSIPHEFLEVITAPPGYLIASGDFDQIDLRVAYNLMLRTEENFPYFQKHKDDYYAGFLNYVMGDEFSEDEFMKMRPALKQGVLAGCYGGNFQTLFRSTQDAKTSKLILDFYKENEKHMGLIRKIDEVLSIQDTVKVTDYFGYTRDVINDKDAMTAILNTPIQSTSNSIVVLLIISAIKKARELGLSSDDFDFYFSRHDEPIFKFKEEYKDIASKILGNLQVIKIDDWLPITVQFSISRNYGIEEEKVPQGKDWIIKTDNKNYSPIAGVITVEFLANKTKNDYDEEMWEVGFVTLDKVIYTLKDTNYYDAIEKMKRCLVSLCYANNISSIKAPSPIQGRELKVGAEYFGSIKVIYGSPIVNTVKATSYLRGDTSFSFKKVDLEEFAKEAEERVKTLSR